MPLLAYFRVMIIIMIIMIITMIMIILRILILIIVHWSMEYYYGHPVPKSINQAFGLFVVLFFGFLGLWW